MDLLTLNSIIDQVFPNILTSMSNAELIGLAKDVASYNLVDTTGFPFELQAANISAGGLCGSGEPVTERAGTSPVAFSEATVTLPSATVQEISNTIINNTGIQ